MRSRWGAALRIARRDALRHKARSLLVVLMVGLPVMLAVGLATVVGTADVDGREALTRTVGASQAFVTTDGFDSPVDQDADGREGSPTGETGTEPDRTYAQSGTDLARRLDARVVPMLVGQADALDVGRDGRSRSVTAVAVDLSDPATRGLVELDRGRLPRTDDEVVVTPSIARSGHEPGQSITVGDASLRVVGVGTTGPRFVAQDGVVVLPGVFDQVAPTEPGVTGPNSSGYLVERDAPVTWQQVQELNRAGYVVTSREVVLDPPRDADEVAGYSSGGDSTLAALVVACIVIEVALLAGPAFAVGARGQRRQLALVAAGGGSPADLRRVVLAGALVLGGIAALLGAVLGVVLTPLAFTAAAPFVDLLRGPLDVPWGWAVLAVVLGVVAAMVAAVVPARQAARRDLVSALTERPDDPRPATGWPALGVALVLGSLALIFSGLPLGGSEETTVALGTVVLVVGVVFLVPLAIGGVGRLAPRLPLAPRIAVRDTARQRARSAPAVAAVMAVVAGITAIAIGSASDFAQSERDYVHTIPEGQVKVSLNTLEGGVVPADDFAADVARVLPDHRLVPVRSATSAVGTDFTWDVRPATCRDSDCAYYADGSSPRIDWASNGLLVADADELAAMGVRLDDAARDALAAGRVLLPASVLAGADTVTLARTDVEDDGGIVPGASETVGAAPADLTVRTDVPAGRRTTVATAVVSPAAAEAAGIEVPPVAVVSDVRDGPLSDADVEALGALELAGNPVSESVQVERGFSETFTIQFLALGVAGGLLVLIGTLTATGLALSDARRDLATLSAVGAAPRTRRAVAASQALVVGLLGSVLGLLVGLVPGWVAATALTAGEYGGGAAIHVLPWDLLALVVVGVPVLAAVVAGLAVRGRAVMARRIA